jgi:hypothetical protein
MTAEQNKNKKNKVTNTMTPNTLIIRGHQAGKNLLSTQALKSDKDATLPYLVQMSISDFFSNMRKTLA